MILSSTRRIFPFQALGEAYPILLLIKNGVVVLEKVYSQNPGVRAVDAHLHNFELTLAWHRRIDVTISIDCVNGVIAAISATNLELHDWEILFNSLMVAVTLDSLRSSLEDTTFQSFRLEIFHHLLIGRKRNKNI